MFGKSLAEYMSFEKGVLVLIAVVGLARLGLSMAGLPLTAVRWLSMTAVVFAAAIYLGVAARLRGFGSYKQLLPLVAIAVVLFQAIVIFGILLAIAGFPNIYAAPEYGGAINQWLHAFIHLTGGVIVTSLVLWGVASLAMLITKGTVRQRSVA